MPTLTLPPTAPSRGSAPKVFAKAMDAFLAWLVLFATQIAALIPNIVSAFDYATAASNSAAAAAASANNKGDYAALVGALNVPATVNYVGYIWSLNTYLANVTTQPPGPGSAYWTCVNPGNAGATIHAARTLGAL